MRHVSAFRNILINITDLNGMKVCRFSRFNNLYRLEQHDSLRASMASYPIKKSVVDFLSGRYEAVSYFKRYLDPLRANSPEFSVG